MQLMVLWVNIFVSLNNYRCPQYNIWMSFFLLVFVPSFQIFVKWNPFELPQTASPDYSSNSLDRNWLVSGDYLSDQTDDLMCMVFLKTTGGLTTTKSKLFVYIQFRNIHSHQFLASWFFGSCSFYVTKLEWHILWKQRRKLKEGERILILYSSVMWIESKSGLGYKWFIWKYINNAWVYFNKAMNK